MFARPKKFSAAAAKIRPSKAVKVSNSEDDISLAAFLLDLKIEKASTATPQNEGMGEESPDKDIMD